MRIGFVAGKPEVQVYGWKMNGKVLKFSNKQNVIYMKLEVIFEEATGISKNYEDGKGIYEIKLMRSGEKFFGNFTGTYNGSSIYGNVKAFYFPKM